jgi:hypothetical protein
MYAAVALIWLALHIAPATRTNAFKFAIRACVMLSGVWHFAHPWHFPSETAARLALMFSTGAA